MLTLRCRDSRFRIALQRVHSPTANALSAATRQASVQGSAPMPLRPRLGRVLTHGRPFRNAAKIKDDDPRRHTAVQESLANYSYPVNGAGALLFGARYRLAERWFNFELKPGDRDETMGANALRATPSKVVLWIIASLTTDALDRRIVPVAA
jgi:hypothetical protein